MVEIICILLFALHVIFIRYIIMAIGVIFGDKSICNEFVDDCVSFKDQLKEHWKVQAEELVEGIKSSIILYLG